MTEKYEERLQKDVMDVIRKTCENDVMLSTGYSMIEPETDLKLDLGFDSIALVVLQVNIEERFGIQFDPLQDDFDEIFQKAGDLYTYVRKKLEDGQ